MIPEVLLGGQGLAARVLAAAVRIGRWALDHPARVREWRNTSEACGFTDVRAVRLLAVPRRLEADAGWLTVSFRTRPPREDDPTRGTVVVGGLASGLYTTGERNEWFGGFDVPLGMADVPPVGGPPLLLCALLNGRARRIVAGLFEQRIEEEDGSTFAFYCRARISERQLTVAYEGELTEAAVRGVVRAAGFLVATEDPAADAAANFHGETHAGVRAYVLRTLVAKAPDHPATAAAVRAGLADASEAVRVEAAFAAGDDGRPVLRALAASERTPDAVAARVTAALGDELASPEVAARLASAIARRRVRTAIVCTELLAERGPAETPPLVAALRSPDPGVVIAAAQALGHHGETREVVVALREAQERVRADADLAAAVRESVRAVQQRLERAGAGQLSVAGPDSGTLALAADARGQVALRPDDPPQS